MRTTITIDYPPNRTAEEVAGVDETIHQVVQQFFDFRGWSVVIGSTLSGVPERLLIPEAPENALEEGAKDFIMGQIDDCYDVLELAINELRDSVFEVGLWRPHNVETTKALVDDAMTLHRAIVIVREILDPREEGETSD